MWLRLRLRTRRRPAPAPAPLLAGMERPPRLRPAPTSSSPPPARSSSLSAAPPSSLPSPGLSCSPLFLSLSPPASVHSALSPPSLCSLPAVSVPHAPPLSPRPSFLLSLALTLPFPLSFHHTTPLPLIFRPHFHPLHPPPVHLHPVWGTVSSGEGVGVEGDSQLWPRSGGPLSMGAQHPAPGIRLQEKKDSFPGKSLDNSGISGTSENSREGLF